MSKKIEFCQVSLYLQYWSVDLLFLGSGLKGADNLYFHTSENFSFSFEATIHPIHFIWDMRGVAAIVYRGPMAKFFSWTSFMHDFELYPSDRELSYDFV